jgi:hypothetical protein
MFNKSKVNLFRFYDEIFMSMKTSGQESYSSVLRQSRHLNRVVKLQLRSLYSHLKVAGTRTCVGYGCCPAMQLSDCSMLALVVKTLQTLQN